MNNVRRKLDRAYQIASKNRDYEGALQICNQIITENPAMTEGLNTRARIYELMDELEQAISDISAVIEIEPSQPDYYFNRGRWHLAIGRLNEAVKDQTKVLEIGKHNDFHYYDESAFFFRALAFLRLSMFEKALADCVNVGDDFLVYSAGLGKLTKEEVVRGAARQLSTDKRC